MAVVIGGIVWLIYGPNLKNMVDGPMLHILRILGLLLCWWILAEITMFADETTGTVTFQYILPLLFISFKKLKIEGK